AHNYQLDPVQMALAFVNNRLFVGSTIIGATTMVQLKTCIQSTTVQLCEALLNDIEQLHSKHPNPALF
ncbi:MAG: aldo/keto reductase, partial [Pseudomonadales bacterium]